MQILVSSNSLYKMLLKHFIKNSYETQEIEKPPVLLLARQGVFYNHFIRFVMISDISFGDFLGVSSHHTNVASQIPDNFMVKSK